MTVNSTSSRVSYFSDGSQVAFTVPYVFTNDEDLKVYVDDVLQTISTDYTVSGGSGSTGTVTFLTSPADGTIVVILRDPPITQLTDYVENDQFPASAHELALDKLTEICQSLDETLARAVTLSVSSTLTGLTLPTPQANKGLRWNDDADGLENFELTDTEAYASEYLLSNYTTIDEALAAIGTETAYLVVDVQRSLTADTTIPQNVGLRGAGGFFKGAYTLTVNGPVLSASKIFDTTVALSGGSGLHMIRPELWGAVGDGSTDDTAAIQAAFDFANTLDAACVFFTGNKTYVVTSTVTSDMENLAVMAYGARFLTGTNDIVFFDLHSGASADGTTRIRNVFWRGGFFDRGNDSTSTYGTAIKCYEVSGFYVDDVRFRGQKIAIDMAILDTATIGRGCRFRNHKKAIRIPSYFTGTLTPQDITVSDCQHTSLVGLPTIFVSCECPVAELTLRKTALACRKGTLVRYECANSNSSSKGILLDQVTTEQVFDDALVYEYGSDAIITMSGLSGEFEDNEVVGPVSTITVTGASGDFTPGNIVKSTHVRASIITWDNGTGELGVVYLTDPTRGNFSVSDTLTELDTTDRDYAETGVTATVSAVTNKLGHAIAVWQESSTELVYAYMVGTFSASDTIAGSRSLATATYDSHTDAGYGRTGALTIRDSRFAGSYAKVLCVERAEDCQTNVERTEFTSSGMRGVCINRCDGLSGVNLSSVTSAISGDTPGILLERIGAFANPSRISFANTIETAANKAGIDTGGTNLSYLDLGRRNNIAAAAEIDLEPDTSYVFVTDTSSTTITTINPTWEGHVVTLVLQSTGTTIQDNVGTNALNGNFSATTGARDNITLICDGTRWLEVSRTTGI